MGMKLEEGRKEKEVKNDGKREREREILRVEDGRKRGRKRERERFLGEREK